MERPPPAQDPLGSLDLWIVAFKKFWNIPIHSIFNIAPLDAR